MKKLTRRKFCLIIVIASAIVFSAWQYDRMRFTPKKWQNASSAMQMRRMVNDFLNKYDIIGFSRDEVIALLGDGYYDEGDTEQFYEYYLGDDGWSMDVLCVAFEDDIVVACYVQKIGP